MLLWWIYGKYVATDSLTNVKMRTPVNITIGVVRCLYLIKPMIMSIMIILKYIKSNICIITFQVKGKCFISAGSMTRYLDMGTQNHTRNIRPRLVF